MQRRMPVEERIEAGVLKLETPDNACWEWKGTRDQNGYGVVMRLTYGKWKTTKAHRLAYEIWTGKKLKKGFPLLHSCDNPPCCRPSHLRPGSQSENVADTVSRNRHAIGERNGHATLTERKVKIIKHLLSLGIGQREIGSRFDISQSHVAHIRRGSIWGHVNG